MSSQMKLEEIDKNFSFESTLDREGLVLYDVRKEPFRLYGFHEPLDASRAFHRIPTDVAESVSRGVCILNFRCAGGRVRFATNSPYIAIRCETYTPIEAASLSPLSNVAGFDLYEETEGGEIIFCNSFCALPNRVGTNGFEALKELPKDGKTREYILNFPTYGSVKNLAIGLHCDAILKEGAPYKYEKPVLFYGSSITQGGCASRPGTTYQAYLSAEFGFDYINLGFSGNAKGEPEIVNYLASLDPMIFVCDYDYNAPTLEHLQKTLPPLYEAVRRAHPDIPFLFLSSPGMKGGKAKRDFIEETAKQARENGDQNVYFVDGAKMFDGPFADNCVCDGCHPNDLGFFRMYEEIAKTFRKIL